MAVSVLHRIADSFARGRDHAAGELVRFMVNRLDLDRYGEMTDCAVDARAKEIRLALRLTGEREDIEVRITYRLERGAGTTRLVCERVTVSREWMDRLANDLLQSRGWGMDLSPLAALAVRVLGI